MKLNHMQSMLLFALVIAIAFAFLSKRKLSDRLKYAIWAFFMFILIGVAIGWAIYPFSR